MKSFEDFYKEKYFFKLHTYSNSGYTDYGISYSMENSDKNPYYVRGYDEILFVIKGSDLTYEQFRELKPFLNRQYKIYCRDIKEKEYYETHRINFFKQHEKKLIKMIPFWWQDHYDTFYINENIEGSRKRFINNITDYNNIDEDAKYWLLYMVVNKLPSIETWH